MDENFQLLCELAKRLSYKPGHNFILERLDDETALVSLRCPSLPNALQSDEVVGLIINNTVPLKEILSPVHALQAFAQVIADFELHEAAEFFQLEGDRVFMPHGWDNQTDDTDGMTWHDFTNLSGRYLHAMRLFLNNDGASNGGSS